MTGITKPLQDSVGVTLEGVDPAGKRATALSPG